MTAAGAPAPMPDPDSVRIWRDDFWWRLIDGSWTAVETRSSGAQWTAPPASGVPADLQSIGQGALALSGGYPIAVASSNGVVYLFTNEWGAVGARQLVGSSSPSALLGLPTPPLIVVLRPHPLGRASVELSSQYVREAIERYKSNRFLIPWVRQTIHAAGLPDPRGRPDPDNVVAALFEQQKREMAFVNDPLHGEMMASPADLLCLDPDGQCLRGGDCDDQIIVLGSAAASAGITVRLRVRRYRHNNQAHVTLEYRLRDGSWKCIDPSTDSGACSTAPYVEQILMNVVEDSAPRLEFVGLGSPDDGGPLGALDELDPEQGAEAVAIALRVHDVLARSAARLRQNSGAASGLGEPPDVETSRLIATADLLSDAIEDGCRGDRPLSVTPDGDLLVGARASDTFAMVVGPDNVPSFAEPDGADHSLRACYLVAERCDRMASALCVQALGEPPADAATLGDLVLPSDVLAYRQAWEPYVMGVARGLSSCAASWRLLASGQTIKPGDVAQPNLSQFATAPDAKELGLWADTLAQEAQSLVDSWNLHAGTTDSDIVLQAGAFLQDYQAIVQRAGSFYAVELGKNCPSIPIPAPPSILDQTQIIARIEGLKILAHGTLQLMGIGASGALETYGAIAQKAGDIIASPVTWGIGGAVLGVGLALGGLYFLNRLGAFAALGGRRAIASSPGRRRRRMRARESEYDRLVRLAKRNPEAAKARIRSWRSSQHHTREETLQHDADLHVLDDDGGAFASAGRIYAEHVRLDRGGYDRSGRYWGTGARLYRVSDEDGELDKYIRAPDAKTAKARVAEGQGSRA